MTNEEIKKALKICDDCPYDGTKNCIGTLLTEAREHITEQENEIIQLQAKNIQLEEQLKKVLLSIDTVKEMSLMCNIYKQVKQAKIDVLNELRERVETAIDTYFNKDGGGYYLAEDAIDDIDELIKEIQNAEDKS